MDRVLSIYNKDYGVLGVYNTTEKIYKTGLVKVRKKSYDIIKGMMKDNTHNGTSSIEELEKYLNKHIRERREKITDLALNNDHWQYFITLTFSDKEIGEYSHDKAIDHLRKW